MQTEYAIVISKMERRQMSELYLLGMKIGHFSLLFQQEGKSKEDSFIHCILFELYLLLVYEGLYSLLC